MLFGDDQARRKAAPFERLRGAHAHDLRMVVVLAQMPQNQCLYAAVQIGFQVIAGVRVREMPVAAHHALLDAPGIRTDLQHFQIVIGFEQQHLHAAQMDFDRFRHVAEIGGHADFDAFGMEAEADRIDGIVGNGEALDDDVADGPAGACLKRLDRRRRAIRLPVDQGRSELRNEDRERFFLLRAAPQQARQTGDMVAVFMGDEDGVDIVDVLADGGEAPLQFPDAEAGIDQNAGFGGREKRRIASTAAREYAEPDQETILLSFVLTRRGYACAFAPAMPPFSS